MDDDIVAGGVGDTAAEEWPARRLIPMKVGTATVFVEQMGQAPSVEVDDDIYPVGAPGLSQAFDLASHAVSECVRLLGGRYEQVDEAIRPQEMTVEFSLSFDAKGRTSIIPVFVTGEAGVQTGLKVSAVWRRTDPQTPGGS